jgi:alpha-glucosidase
MDLPIWTESVHHDGSALFVSNQRPGLNETVILKLRAAFDAPIARAYIRTAPDGEGRFEAMRLATTDPTCQWWEGTMRLSNPKNHYRFKLITNAGEAYHFTAGGISRVERPDWFDFRIVAGFDGPDWLDDAVFYQIFPDRFYNGDPALTPKPGAWSVGSHTVTNPAWDELPKPWRETGNLDFYGGDLPGIAQKLDYLADLGVNALYLTPIFVSTSNHRYDVSDFDHIDPGIGGDEGLAALREALDQKQFRLILDITLNHCGYNNHWFRDAQADLTSPTADFFTFYNNDPNQYECWLGVRSLPKLNYSSETLRARMWGNHDSIMRRWLRSPYRIDGWRLDVANMQGQQGASQLGHKIGRALRRAVKAENPNAYVFGEHFFDGTPHLQGDEIDASMNYAGFTFALWQWLSGRENGTEWRPDTVDQTLLPGEAVAESWRAYRAAIPWSVQRQQFTLLDSHDTARISLKVQGNKALIKLAATFQMMYPGVPCVYYGDEIGLEGGTDPDNRRTMPWDDSRWDRDLQAHYKQIIHLRRTQPALTRGGFQQLYAEGPLISFQRQSQEQRLIIIGHRGPDPLAERMIPVWQSGIPEGTRLVDLLGGREFVVTNGHIRLTQIQAGDALILEARN